MHYTPSSWQLALPAYLVALGAAGRSPGTVRLQMHYLSQLRGRCPGNPFLISTHQLRELLANPAWSPETRKSCRTAVRGFYRWAHDEGYVAPDPAARLDPVRVPAGQPRPAPEQLVESLLAHTDARTRLMVELAALAGLRAAEISRVHAADYVAGSLRIAGKGGRVRVVPVVDAQLAGRLAGLEGWAFPNGQGSHLTPGHVSRLLSRAMPAGWTAHTLRHRLATAAYAGTRDLLAVSALLGHSRPETTQRYVAMPDDALRVAVHAAARPGCRPGGPAVLAAVPA